MLAMQINIHEAQAHLSRLIDRAVEGEEITIAKDGVPAVRLVPVRPTEGKRKLGLYRDEIWIANDFDAPLPPDLLAGFLGEDSASEATDDKPDLKNKAKRRKKK